MNQADTATKTPEHIPRLDVLRALAILLVVLFHYFGRLAAAFHLAMADPSAGDFNRALDSFILQASLLGTSGVPLFFVISGFCIHLSVLRGRKAFTTRDFYWRRFLRIYPAYLIALVFFSILGSFNILGSLTFKMFLGHLLLVHNFYNYQFLISINGAFWSLAVEWQFYLLYPLLLIVRAKWGLKACLFYAILLCLGEQILCSLSPTFTQLSQDRFLIGRTVGTWCDWILGACLAEAFEQRERLFRQRGIWLAASLALFIVGRSFPFIFEFRFLLDSLFCAVLMETYLASSKPLIWLERVLIPVGLVSYSIYLWHQPLIKPVWFFLHSHIPLAETPLWEICFYFPLVMLILSPIFVASYWVGEKISPALIRRWTTARTVPAARPLPPATAAPTKVHSALPEPESPRAA